MKNESKKDCIIYGVGRWGNLAYEEFSAKRKILFYVDANEKIQGKKLNGLLIKPLSALHGFEMTEVLLAVAYGSAEIKGTLLAMGMKNVKRYCPGAASLPDGDLPKEERSIPAVLTEVTASSVNKKIVGVTRTIYKIMSEICCRENILPVRVADDKLITNYAFRSRFVPSTSPVNEKMIKFVEGDTLFFLDTTWTRELQKLFDYARKHGVCIYTLIYDLHPTYEYFLKKGETQTGVLSSYYYTLINSSALIT